MNIFRFLKEQTELTYEALYAELARRASKDLKIDRQRVYQMSTGRSPVPQWALSAAAGWLGEIWRAQQKSQQGNAKALLALDRQFSKVLGIHDLEAVNTLVSWAAEQRTKDDELNKRLKGLRRSVLKDAEERLKIKAGSFK